MRDEDGNRIVDHSWVAEKGNLQGNCEAYAQAIEQGLPEELNFVLLMFPRGAGKCCALAGKGSATEVAKALKASLESANRIRNRQGGRIVLPG